jgi:hypothetical protein
MKSARLAQQLEETAAIVEHTVAVVAIRIVGILGALTFLSASVYECVRFAKDVWYAR